MYCLFPWSMPGPAPWSHGICVTRWHAYCCNMSSWFLCFPKICAQKIKDLTFQHKPFRRIAWTSSLPRAVELGICKDSRRGLGILSNLQSRGRNLQRGALHVANILIIARFCMFAPAASTHAFNRKQFWRLCSGPEPGTYSGKLRIWQSICVCLHTCCICCIRMYCLFPWSMPGPAPWSHGICVTRVLLQYVPLISLFPKDQIKDQGSDIPTQAFSKNCLDILIAKSGGSRHLPGLTARSGNSFNSNLQSRGRNLQRGALHVANTLIIALILHVCSSCFHACVYQKTCLKALQWTRARHLQWKTSDLTIHLSMLAYALYLLSV